MTKQAGPPGPGTNGATKWRAQGPRSSDTKAPKKVPRPPRRAGSPAPVTIPAGVAYFELRYRGSPTKLRVPGPDGVVIDRIPVALFTVDTIKRTWGAAQYRVHWYTEVGRAAGSNVFELGGNGAGLEPAPTEAVPGAAAPVPSSGPAASTELPDGLRVAQSIQDLADRRAAGVIDGAIRMMQVAGGGASTTQLLAAIAEGQRTLAAALQSLPQMVAAAVQTAVGETDDDDDEGEEVDEPAQAPPSATFREAPGSDG